MEGMFSRKCREDLVTVEEVDGWIDGRMFSAPHMHTLSLTIGVNPRPRVPQDPSVSLIVLSPSFLFLLVLAGGDSLSSLFCFICSSLGVCLLSLLTAVHMTCLY